MKLRTTYIDYAEDSNGRLIARLAGRGEDGERHVKRVKGVTPTIYVPEDEPVPENTNVTGVETGFESFDDVPLKRLDLTHPQETENVKADFSVAYESDLPFYRKLSVRDGLNGVIEVPERRDIRYSDIETDATADIDPRICIADIEVLPSDNSVETMKENADQPVVCVTMWDSYTSEYAAIVWEKHMATDLGAVKQTLADHWDEEPDLDVTFWRCETESDVLNRFVDQLKEWRPDVIGGWNFTDFDWEYLLRRMKKLDSVNPHPMSDVGAIGSIEYAANSNTVERVVPGLPSFDMMTAFCDDQIGLSGHRWRSKALDYVADEEFGVGKVEGISVEETFETDLARLLAYNIIDVQLCVKIEQQNALFDFFFEVAEFSSIPVYDAFRPMRLVDGYIMSRRGRDEVLPEMVEKDVDRSSGGLVLSPQNGIFDNIAVVDLKSLYPSTIITCNISPETLRNEATDDCITIPSVPGKEEEAGGTITTDDITWETDDGALAFDLSEEGIIPKYLRRLFPERARQKAKRNEYTPDDPEYDVYDRKQAAVKVIMNCFSPDTEVMTPSGVRNITNIEVGDEVYSINPESHELEVKPVTDTTTSPNLYGELHHIEGADTDFMVTENHRMFTDRGFIEYGDCDDWVRYQIPAHEPVDGERRETYNLVTDGGVDGRLWLDYEGHGRTMRHRLPLEVRDALEYAPNRRQFRLDDLSLYTAYREEIHQHSRRVTIQKGRKHSSVPVEYDIDDWLELMGWYISEGYIKADARTDAVSCRLAQKTEPGRTEIETLLGRMGLSPKRGKNGIGVNNGIIAGVLEAECGSGSYEKRLPGWVFDLDSSHLQHIYDTAMAGDGHIKGKHRKYTTASDELKEGIVQLLVRLGYKPFYHWEGDDGSGVWRINHTRRGGFRPATSSKVVESDDPVHCITVADNHTILAGRNGKFQWVGQSVYGALNSPYYRLGKLELGEAITGASRYVLWKSGEIIEEMGYDVAYGDTDSLFLSLEDEEKDHDAHVLDVKGVTNQLNDSMYRVADDIGVGDEHPYVADTALHGNSDRHCWLWEFEKFYARWLQGGTKKRYAGHIVWKEGKWVDETEVSGFESRRSDSPPVAAAIQREVLGMILRGEDFDAVSARLRDEIATLKDAFETQRHAKPASYNPPYKIDTSPTIRGVEFSNEHLDYNWMAGDSPWLVYVAETPPGLPETDVIAIDWNEGVPAGFTIDEAAMTEKCFEQPLSAILDVVGWDFKELKTGNQTEGITGDGETTNPFAGKDIPSEQTTEKTGIYDW